MLVTETMFIDGVPVGQIQQDSFTGMVKFKPKNGSERLTAKTWRNVDELKQEIQEAYKDKSPRS